jgi:hypothetical protein
MKELLYTLIICNILVLCLLFESIDISYLVPYSCVLLLVILWKYSPRKIVKESFVQETDIMLFNRMIDTYDGFEDLLKLDFFIMTKRSHVEQSNSELKFKSLSTDKPDYYMDGGMEQISDIQENLIVKVTGEIKLPAPFYILNYNIFSVFWYIDLKNIGTRFSMLSFGINDACAVDQGCNTDLNFVTNGYTHFFEITCSKSGNDIVINVNIMGKIIKSWSLPAVTIDVCDMIVFTKSHSTMNLYLNNSTPLVNSTADTQSNVSGTIVVSSATIMCINSSPSPNNEVKLAGFGISNESLNTTKINNICDVFKGIHTLVGLGVEGVRRYLNGDFPLFNCDSTNDPECLESYCSALPREHQSTILSTLCSLNTSIRTQPTCPSVTDISESTNINHTHPVRNRNKYILDGLIRDNTPSNKIITDTPTTPGTLGASSYEIGNKPIHLNMDDLSQPAVYDHLIASYQQNQVNNKSILNY